MAAISTLIDAFNFADTGLWSGFGANIAVSGTLRITCTSSYPSLVSNTSYDLTGSACFVESVSQPNLGLGSTSCQLSLILDSGNQLIFLKEGSAIAAVRKVAAANTTVNSTTFNATTHRWWKISESGGTVTWWTAPDGVTWTSFTTWAPTFSVTALSVSLISGFFDAETNAGSAIFDNVNTIPVVDPRRLPIQTIQVP